MRFKTKVAAACVKARALPGRLQDAVTIISVCGRNRRGSSPDMRLEHLGERISPIDDQAHSNVNRIGWRVILRLSEHNLRRPFVCRGRYSRCPRGVVSDRILAMSASVMIDEFRFKAKTPFVVAAARHKD